ncbi:hypothetical protein BH24GEM3_BH24GEM3_23060 [soil metagenome]
MSNQSPAVPEPPAFRDPAPVHAPAPVAPQSFAGMPPGREPGFNWRRYTAALVRYKWLMLGVILLGVVAGIGIARLIPPQYAASTTIWIENSAMRAERGGGPIRSAELLRSQAWVELLRSYAVLEPVAREQGLFVATSSAADSAALGSLRLQEVFTPGSYRLAVDPAGRGFELSAQDGTVLQRGTVGEPIGQELGFDWTPAPEALRPGRTIEFSIRAPSDVIRSLTRQMRTTVDQTVNFISIEFTGRDPQRAAATANSIAERFVEVAAELKRAQLEELTEILQEQLHYAEGNLRDAEVGLENFRVTTATLPSDRDAYPVFPGQQRDPAISSFFEMRTEREQLRQDREAIQRAIAAGQRSGMGLNALEVVPSAQASTELRTALGELTSKRAELRALQYRYTDEYPPVQQLQEEIARLERQTIPSVASSVVGQLAAREGELQARVESASSELRQIPTRTIEEARLVRRVSVAENLYTNLRQRFEESRLAAASAIPDVRVLDRATAPRQPVNDAQRQRMMLMALLGSVGLAVFGAILLDRMDSRLRYPEQVTHGMGLPILGAVPQLQTDKGRLKQESTAQIVEAFREIRLALMHAYGSAGPLMLTVTSPNAGDGKSFISSNLALAFADLGYRTLLIDGDIRKGGLHRLFERIRRPGLTDFLAGRVPFAQIVQSTASPSLDLIACGTRMQDGPELLGTAAMSQMLVELRSRYEVILVDSPPLGAGVDPFALGTLTGNLLLVLRSGSTDRTLAEAKLDLMDRLPVRILGAVLNDVEPRGVYRYYAYLAGYEAHDERGVEPEEESKQLQGV